eukprot:850638-Pleurochrysis_carterae.AAC.1
MPQAREKGALPCAWQALFGACEKQATGECDNCKYDASLPADKRVAAPRDIVARVKAACTPPLAASIH